MAQHTPGPWIAHRYTTAVETTVAAADGKHIADVYALAFSADGERHRACTPTDIANARLIAAAPDLLAAAKQVAQWVEQNPATHPYDAWKALEAAIAKAEPR